MEIRISKKIKQLTPNFNVGVIIANVEVLEEERINVIINKLEEDIFAMIDIKDVVSLDIIKDGRDAYKKYGKDPSRYRLAVESLYRRLSKGNKLYRINNIVDLGNIVSLKTRKSVAVLDYSKINSDILIRLGKSEDDYYGIGRGKINIENIPLYEDDLGPFGSVTSDTERTMISNNTKKILLLIVSFSGKEHLESEIQEAINLYVTYAKATIITSFMV